MDYYFEQVQKFKVSIYDIDDIRGALDDQDFLGEGTFTLGEVVGARGQHLTRKLERIATGSVTVQAEELVDLNAQVKLWFSARKLDKKDFFGSSGTCCAPSISHTSLMFRDMCCVCAGLRCVVIRAVCRFPQN